MFYLSWCYYFDFFIILLGGGEGKLCNFIFFLNINVLFDGKFRLVDFVSFVGFFINEFDISGISKIYLDFKRVEYYS